MPEKCIFIGGYQDGERHEVSTTCRHVKFEELPPLTIDSFKRDTMEVKVHTYRRTIFQGEHRQWHVYILDSINNSAGYSYDHATQLLLDRYSPRNEILKNPQEFKIGDLVQEHHRLRAELNRLEILISERMYQ